MGCSVLTKHRRVGRPRHGDDRGVVRGNGEQLRREPRCGGPRRRHEHRQIGDHASTRCDDEALRGANSAAAQLKLTTVAREVRARQGCAGVALGGAG